MESFSQGKDGYLNDVMISKMKVYTKHVCFIIKLNNISFFSKENLKSRYPT